MPRWCSEEYASPDEDQSSYGLFELRTGFDGFSDVYVLTDGDGYKKSDPPTVP